MQSTARPNDSAWLVLGRSGKVSPDKAKLEIVERKGVGHPDTLADGIAELASVNYCKYCIAEFGAVLHHNLDKVGVFGGLARFSWSSGEFIRPVRVIFGGRASFSFSGKSIPVREILEAAAREYLEYSLPGYSHLKIEFLHYTSDSSKNERWFNPTTLQDLPEYLEATSNDTAYLIGGAPRTATETATLICESFLRQRPWAGSDIKVMAVRLGRRTSITIAVPALVGAFTGVGQFRDAIHESGSALQVVLSRFLQTERVEVSINVKPHVPGRGAPAQSEYVTVSGSAVDYGEDGFVGRGNSRSGLITPNRKHGTEALFGKNPTYHTGKVAGFICDELARALATGEVTCECTLVTRIGMPFSTPHHCSVVSSVTIDRHRVLAIFETVSKQEVWMKHIVGNQSYVPRMSALSLLMGG